MKVMDWREMTTFKSIQGKLSHAGQLGSFPLGLITCPYCDTDGKFVAENEEHREEGKGRFSSASWMFLTCQVCSNMTFVIYGQRDFAEIIDYTQFPLPAAKAEAHPSWPPAAGRFFTQAQESLKSRSWDAAAVMARSALQVVLRDKGATGRTLAAETDDLVQKGLLVSSMAEWAKEIREEGNDAAHPKVDAPGATEKDARQIVDFTHYLLHYLYSIPAQIEERKANS